VDYTAGAISWGRALRNAAAGMLPRLRSQRRPGWSLLVPAVCLLAGLLFTTTATTARGTDLRNDRRPELATVIAERKLSIEQQERRAAALRSEIEDTTAVQAGSDSRVAAERARAQTELGPAGLVGVHGPGLTVRLNDAPKRPDGSWPAGARPDDLVVHQQDVQGVVNALWAGGAEAMTVMGVRVISTIAVRCVGNTLLLDGRVYSPPFEIVSIGDPAQLQRALESSEAVRKVEGDVIVKSYNGSIDLRNAQRGS
jgi:uncharacterized protein YlxW (UPF0749 family)